MTNRTLIVIVLCVGQAHWCTSQSTTSTKDEKKDYLSLTFENDLFYFQKPSDQYYTNGFKYERVGPGYEKRNYLLNKLLLGFRKKKRPTALRNYGFFFGQNIYTPTDITISDIQTDDRPYAGWLYFGVKKMSTDTARNIRLTSELYIGIIGPYSFAGETQAFVHKLTDSAPPQGWDNQIDSDLGILYANRFEFQLVPFPKAPRTYIRVNESTKVRKNYFEVISFGELQVGTIYNNVGGGLMLRAGLLTPYLHSYNSLSTTIPSFLLSESKKIQKILRNLFDIIPEAFIFARPQVRALAYNSMMQGGVLNPESVYTIKKDDVHAFYSQIDYGLAIRIRSVTFSLYQSIRTKEFAFAKGAHRWGGVNILINY
ncbi:MAG TPA: lipid A deacylase LpxR family protein [Chryseolinea sp.]|nr:lipid A deacylase LpxR family protein [Chryseolinea sp.]